MPPPFTLASSYPRLLHSIFVYLVARAWAVAALPTKSWLLSPSSYLPAPSTQEGDLLLLLAGLMLQKFRRSASYADFGATLAWHADLVLVLMSFFLSPDAGVLVLCWLYAVGAASAAWPPPPRLPGVTMLTHYEVSALVRASDTAASLPSKGKEAAPGKEKGAPPPFGSPSRLGRWLIYVGDGEEAGGFAAVAARPPASLAGCKFGWLDVGAWPEAAALLGLEQGLFSVDLPAVVCVEGRPEGVWRRLPLKEQGGSKTVRLSGDNIVRYFGGEGR